jgi:hypothetical protein
MIGEDDFVNVSDINQYRSPHNCTECDLCLLGSVNKKRWMAFTPPTLPTSFQELDGPNRRINKIFEELAPFFDAFVQNTFRRVLVTNLVHSCALLRFNPQCFFSVVCRFVFHGRFSGLCKR